MDIKTTQLQVLADSVNQHPATLVMRAISETNVNTTSINAINEATVVNDATHSLFLYNTYSLHQIKHEVMSGLKRIEDFLAEFTQDFDMDDVETEVELILAQANELAKAVEFVGLSGAAELLAYLPAALQKLIDQPEQKLAEDLSVAVMFAQRYVQFSLNMQALAPQLLIDITNTIEAHLKQPLSSEGLYIRKFINLKEQATPLNTAQNTSAKDRFVAAQHLQKLYQHNLLLLLSSDGDNTHAQTLEKISITAYNICAGLPDEQFWYAVSLALHNLDIKSVLTKQRKRVLLGVGQQLARLGSLPDDKLWYDVLAKAMTREVDAAPAMRSHYNINNRITSDANIDAIKYQMFGPSSSTVQMVVDTLLEELNKVSVQLDRRFAPGEVERALQNMALSLFDVANMIEFVVNTDGLPASIKLFASELSQMKEHPDEDFIDRLLTLITYAENALLLTARKHTIAGALLPVGNVKISQAKVEDAFEHLIEEARSSIITAISGLNSFSKNPSQSVHLANVPTILESLYGATLFLLNHQASAALHRLHQILVRKIQNTTETYRMNIATGCIEVLTYIDYYFTNVANKLPIGPLVYDLIDSQLKQLESSYNMAVQV